VEIIPTLAVVNTIKLALEMPEDSPKHRLRQKRVKELMTLRLGGILLPPPLIPSYDANSVKLFSRTLQLLPKSSRAGKAQATLGTGVQAGGGGAEARCLTS